MTDERCQRCGKADGTVRAVSGRSLELINTRVCAGCYAEHYGPDERITEIRSKLKKARGLVMDAARLSDEIHDPETHRREMHAVTVIDDAMDSHDQVETKLHLIETAYDEDIERLAKEERHLRVLDEESEREEARKVGETW